MIFSWPRGAEHQKEEQIDYADMSNDQLLDCFKSTHWDGLDDDERLDLAQEFEIRNAAGQGRPPAQVVPLYDDQYYGKYDDQYNILYLNVRDFSSYDVLDTCVHEGNHADQSARIARQECQGNATQSMIQAESARDNWGNLYNYVGSGPLYTLQCNEMESNNQAATFLLTQAPRYSEDPAFREYISKRADYYTQVNQFMETQGEERIERQNQQALRAFSRGDITPEQFRDITTSINRENYLDTEAIRTQELNADLQDLREQYFGESMEDEAGAFDYADTTGQEPGGYGADSFDYTGDAGQLADGQDQDDSAGQDRDSSAGQEGGQSM